VHYTNKPCALFCDWSYQYYFEHFLKRDPDWLERPEVLRQNTLFEQVQQIFVLFPDVAERMGETYQNPHIHYLGNVINATPGVVPVPPQQKQQQQRILFIGRAKYMEGVQSLIEAVRLLHLRAGFSGITLDIIGMTGGEIGNLPDYVTCHGYLNKDHPEEKATYDSLLANATIYVNTTPQWAGFSSALEALYHSIPVITTPYQSFMDTFGEEITMGSYCDSNEPLTIAEKIVQILSLSASEYTLMCHNAHEVSLDFTWDSYVNKMMHILAS